MPTTRSCGVLHCLPPFRVYGGSETTSFSEIVPNVPKAPAKCAAGPPLYRTSSTYPCLTLCEPKKSVLGFPSLFPFCSVFFLFLSWGLVFWESKGLRLPFFSLYLCFVLFCMSGASKIISVPFQKKMWCYSIKRKHLHYWPSKS